MRNNGHAPSSRARARKASPALEPGMVVNVPIVEFRTLPTMERVRLVRCIARRTDEWLVSVPGCSRLQRRTVSAVLAGADPKQILCAFRLLWRTGTVMPELLWSPFDDVEGSHGEKAPQSLGHTNLHPPASSKDTAGPRIGRRK